MSHPHSHPGKNQPPYERESGVLHLFKRWPLWIAVALMLIAMVTYVLTLNESEAPQAPGAGPPPPVPAAAP
jgi:hypothetical protein